MKICLVGSPLHPVPPVGAGALERQIAIHATGLAKTGHDVHVATVEGDLTRRGLSAPDVAQPDSVCFHRLGAAFEPSPARGARRLWRHHTRYAREVRRLLTRMKPDLVHWHAPHAGLAGLRESNDSRWRNIYHAHNWKRAERMSYPLCSVRRVAAKVAAQTDVRLARRADHLIAVSEFVRGQVLATGLVAAERVSVLTNAVDSERFRPADCGPDELALEDRSPQLLFVGRVAAEKGLFSLLGALPDVLHEVPDARLTVVGPASGGTESGRYRRRCERRVGKLGLKQHVRFAGVVPNADLPALMRQCRAVAIPSVWGEPCGVVVLEALACGVPVVASRVGGIPELVEERKTGLLVDPRARAAWSSALLTALRDEGLRATCRREGPRSVAERHTWQVLEPRLLAIYQSVLARAPRKEAL